MYFLYIYTEVIYIIVSIKIHIGNIMDKGHYVCDILYYNTGTWWDCYNATITKYLGYPKNLSDDLSNYLKKKRIFFILYGSDIIVSMLYIKIYIFESSTYSFITGISVSKEMEHIKERKLI